MLASATACGAGLIAPVLEEGSRGLAAYPRALAVMGHDTGARADIMSVAMLRLPGMAGFSPDEPHPWSDPNILEFRSP
jgi:hypothetical protein